VLTDRTIRMATWLLLLAPLCAQAAAPAKEEAPAKDEPVELSTEDYRRLRKLCFHLGENEPGKKWDAARTLIETGPKAVPVVAEVLEGEWTEGKQVAAWVLSEIRHPSAVGPLAHALDDPDEDVRWKAAVGLKQIGEPSVYALIAVLLQDHLGAKRCAAWTLGEIAHPAGAGSLAAALEEADEELRWKAAISLSQIGESALTALTKPLRHERVETRRAAIWAAGQIDTQAALPVLAQALDDPDNHVRAKAVVALGNIEGERATQLLLKMVKDDDPVVRKDAIVALGRRGKTVDPEARVEKRAGEPTEEVERFAAFTVTFRPEDPPELANPYADAAVSGSFVSPDDRTFRVPGFYAGDGTWAVRTSFDVPGDWFYRLDFEADGATQTTHGSVKVLPGERHGGLRIDREHRRFLVFEDGSRYYPIGSGVVTLGQPGNDGTPAHTLDVWKQYLADCAEAGMNKTHILLLEAPWIAPAVVRRHPELAPWPVGEDGRYDLSRFALPYWQKLDAVIAAAAEHGIVVELTVFDESGLARGDGEQWALHPFNADNGGPVEGLSGSPRFYDLSEEANRTAQDAYVAYLLARTVGFPNVIYELNTHMNRRGTAGRLGIRWGEHWARFFRERDPFDHLASLHVVQDPTGYYLIEGVDIANVHGESVPEPTGIRMPVFLSQPYAKDAAAQRALFWRALLLGTATARTPWPSLAERPPAFESLRYLADYAATVNYWELSRDRDVVLSTPGGTQALAVGRDGETLILLTGASRGGVLRVGLQAGRYGVSWFDPKNGRTVRAEEIRPAQGAAELTCPTFEDDILLRIRKK
jgi:HEAT repeat protein